MMLHAKISTQRGAKRKGEEEEKKEEREEKEEKEEREQKTHYPIMINGAEHMRIGRRQSFFQLM
jgi:hypothetical protein